MEQVGQAFFKMASSRGLGQEGLVHLAELVAHAISSAPFRVWPETGIQ
jgi:hypothetical protein